MNRTYQKYNLKFINNVFRGKVSKTCDLIANYASPLYINLSTYLIYLQDIDNINLVLEEINNALGGLPAENISEETVDIILDTEITIINWNGKTESIPTLDLKEVLLEYANFLRTPPLNGDKA